MDKATLAFVRVIQFSILVFFALVLSAFFGTLVLLPLALLYHFIGFLTDVIGFNAFFAFIFAVPTVGYIFYFGYKIPGFYDAVLETGFKLFRLARDQHTALEKIAQASKGLPDKDEPAAADTASTTSNSNN